MSGLGRVGHLLAGATLLALPLTAVFGCGNDMKDAEILYLYDQQANGRTAYLKTDGGFNGDNAETGTASSNIEIGDTEASFNFDTNDSTGGGLTGFSDSKTGTHKDPTFAEFGPTTLYGDAGGRRIEVTKLGDVDGDGTSDDAFLMFTHDKPGKEFSMSYGGTRSTLKEIDDIKKKAEGHTATYKGKGEFYTAIGPNVFRHKGDLDMKATFSGATAGIEGEIKNLTQTDGGAPVPAPVAFDNLKFTGKFDDQVSPDYETSDWAHYSGSKQITKLTSKGVGSFFGSKAGGTIGVFSGTGTVIHGGSKVNLLGGYHGTTGDNN